MKITIRQEKSSDHQSVFQLIEKAFEKEVYSDHREQFLVDNLRQSDAFIPELSLVAIVENAIVGHILLTKIGIKNEEEMTESLALAPVSVLPMFQGKGIGGQLIKTAHKIAKEAGYSSVVLLGHEKYYPRFGYQRADKFDIELPFDAPKENCMAIELRKDGLKNVKGTVIYSKEFYDY